MKDELAGRAERGWDVRRKGYVCRDGRMVDVPRRRATARDPDEMKIAPRSGIVYRVGKKEPRIAVSGAQFSRNTGAVFGGPNDAETIIFPSTIRTVRQGAFSKAPSLRAVILNEGLKILGTDEYKPDETRYFGVFEESALELVDLPHTLKRSEYNTFKGCTRLKSIKLPERPEYIGKYCFKGSALEGVYLLSTLKTINEHAFYKCG